MEWSSSSSPLMQPTVVLADCMEVQVRVPRLTRNELAVWTRRERVDRHDDVLDLELDERLRLNFINALDIDTDDADEVRREKEKEHSGDDVTSRKEANEDDVVIQRSKKRVRRVVLKNLLGSSKNKTSVDHKPVADDDNTDDDDSDYNDGDDGDDDWLGTIKSSGPIKERIVKRAEKSEYEKLRERNISERMALFNKHFKEDINSLKHSLFMHNKVDNKLRKLDTNNLSVRRKRLKTQMKPRRRSKRLSTGSPSLSENLAEEDDESEECFDAPVRRQRRIQPHRWHFNPNDDVLSVDDVSQLMIDNVAQRVSDKVYSQTNGTTCHQCRQKTTDTKTICRSGYCVGGRGMFCGVCLHNRYGERAQIALKDPNWMCPPCKDICNCSICRNRVGKGATGPITYLAQARGFTSVKDYLEHMYQKYGREDFDEDDASDQEDGDSENKSDSKEVGDNLTTKGTKIDDDGFNEQSEYKENALPVC